MKTISYDSNTQVEFKRNWWAQPDAGAQAVSVATRIQADAKIRLERSYLDYARLYANQMIPSLYAAGTTRTPGIPTSKAERPSSIGHHYTYNVVQSVCDTLFAKLGKNQPRVQFLTSGATYAQQREAKMLTKFTDGVFYKLDAYKHTRAALENAIVFGDGWLKHYIADGELKLERVLPWEILYDESEACTAERQPRSMYQLKYISREVAMQLWGDTPEAKDQIMAAGALDVLSFYSTCPTDMIPIYEAWHLPSSDGAKDGRHVIACGTATLYDERWKFNRFPFTSIRWKDRITGIRGLGVAEQLVGKQMEINQLLRTIQRAQHAVSVPRVYLEHGSRVIKSHLTDDVGDIVEYTGAPPIISVGQAMSSEVYQHVRDLYAKAFEESGVSQLSATGQKPSGLNAAVALREYHDVESERFSDKAQEFEHFHVRLARDIIDTCRVAWRNNKIDTLVNVKNAHNLDQVRWSEIDLDEDAYIMQAFPTSSLPTTPAGRLQHVSELYSSGMLTDQSAAGSWAREALAFPDLEQLRTLQGAALEDARRTVERIVEHGEYDAPEPYQNLQLLSEVAQETYLEVRLKGVPEKRLELLRRLISECQEMVAGGTGAAPGQLAAAQAAQGGEQAAPAGEPAILGPEGMAPGMGAMPPQV